MKTMTALILFAFAGASFAGPPAGGHIYCCTHIGDIAMRPPASGANPGGNPSGAIKPDIKPIQAGVPTHQHIGK